MNNQIAICLNEKELKHCINDIINYKNKILERVVGTCDISPQEINNLPQEKLEMLKMFGYFSRIKLLKKLEMLERIYFPHCEMQG